MDILPFWVQVGVPIRHKTNGSEEIITAIRSLKKGCVSLVITRKGWIYRSTLSEYEIDVPIWAKVNAKVIYDGSIEPRIGIIHTMPTITLDSEKHNGLIYYKCTKSNTYVVPHYVSMLYFVQHFKQFRKNSCITCKE